jgi:hypothetical protein
VLDDLFFEHLVVQLEDDWPEVDLHRLINEAARTGEAIVNRIGRDHIDRFNPSCGLTAYRILRALRRENLPLGNRFCEWGSGLGTVALIAHSLGFDACGIEIEPELVDLANAIAGRFDLACPFYCANIYPDDATSLKPLPVDYTCLDVVYAYPWPAEVSLFKSLFRTTCSRPGALLILFRGGMTFEVLRRRC